MPLSSSAVDRSRLHVRGVTYEGYRRSDELFDIEGHLTDVKDQDYALLTGVRRAGDPVHDMWIRLTIGSDYLIRAIEVRTDEMPYPGACDLITPAYDKLVGASLLHGFRRTLQDTMGGVRTAIETIRSTLILPLSSSTQVCAEGNSLGPNGPP
jgi:hypothetical protein